MFRLLTNLTDRRPWIVVLCAVVFAGAAGYYGGPVAGLMSNGAEDFDDPASESVRAEERLAEAADANPGADIVALVGVGEEVRSPAGKEKLVDVARKIGDDAIENDFPPSRTSPIYLAVEGPDDEETGENLGAYVAKLEDLRGVDAVVPPRPVDEDTWQIDVIPTSGVLSEKSQALVEDVRALDAPYPVQAGGLSAEFVDQQASLLESVPYALAIVFVSTLVLLFLFTGSVVLPVKTFLMNALTVGATFGILVWIFQYGRLENLLAYASQGALDNTQPILVLIMAFGLSTDYGVFLLSRIKEARESGLDDTEAVAVGLGRTGRIITAAALLFCVAIGAFATSQIVFIKELGVGAALAVLIDATIVRALLVPSLMKLLGGRNWWSPRPLKWLHERIGLGESVPTEHAPERA
jgi:uncharacterized membrane protein YdfJ with MMPL/SSD domain